MKLLRKILTKKRIINNNRGFTLMEVIIVIILLGIIMITFGKKMGNLFTSNNTKAVAANVLDDLRAIDDGAQGYQASTTTEAANLGVLTTSGNLNNTPTPNSAATVTATSYTWDTATYTTLGPTAAADTVVYLDDVTQAVCAEVNNKANGTSAIVVGVNAAWPTQCFGPVSGKYRVVKLIYGH